MNETLDIDETCPPCPVCEAGNGDESVLEQEVLTMNLLMVFQSSIVPISEYETNAIDSLGAMIQVFVAAFIVSV